MPVINTLLNAEPLKINVVLVNFTPLIESTIIIQIDSIVIDTKAIAAVSKNVFKTLFSFAR